MINCEHDAQMRMASRGKQQQNSRVQKLGSDTLLERHHENGKIRKGGM